MDLSFFHSFLDRYTEQNGFSGVIRICKGDQILADRAIGYADAEQRIAFSQDSMFTFYSLSKPFCAIGVMLLAERGLVDLEAHPGMYLPIFRGRFSGLTVRHLLNHTSGLPDFLRTGHLYERFGVGAPRPIREQLEALLAEPAGFAPGAGAQYANVNFAVCALIAEAVTGEEYARYMRREVFSPLGMQTALVDRLGLQVPNRVVGYGKNEAGAIFPVEKDYYGMFGAGDLIGTLEDAACLPRAIRRRELLSERSWQQILTPSPLNHMGLGCTAALWHGKTRIMHTGGSAGFRNMHIFLPNEELDFLLLSNYGFGSAREDIAEAFFEAAFGRLDAPTQRVEPDKGYI